MTIQVLFEKSFESAEEFILNFVGDRIENVSEIPEILHDIKYLDSKENLILHTTKCEILDISEYHISKYDVKLGFINVKFNMAFIMQTFVNSNIYGKYNVMLKPMLILQTACCLTMRNLTLIIIKNIQI